MASPNGRFRDRSRSPSIRELRNHSPVPSIRSISSNTTAQSSVVVESLKKKSSSGHAAHRSRRVIGAESFNLPPPVAEEPSTDGGDEANNCPICGESMTTRLSLKRHLEDVHRASEGGGAQSTFMKYINKAKNFTPVHAFNQTLQYADLSDLAFTSGTLGTGFSPEGHIYLPPGNGSGYAGPGAAAQTGGVTFVGPHNVSSSHVHDSHSHHVVSGGVNGHHKQHVVHQKPQLTEDMVTRAHWQRETGNDRCSEFKCRTQLNSRVGKVNCRSCGRLFCEEHVSCSMKLDKQAKWDPEKGVWCRVCFSCFESRPGFNDASGMVEDLTSAFIAKRKRTITKTHLEVNLLEKRLTRLIKLMIETNDPSVTRAGSLTITVDNGAKTLATDAVGVAATLATGYFKQIRNYRKPPEQEVVAWQDDKDVEDCPYCERKFSFSMRKHHCRLCGKVVCGSPDTACSSQVTLDFERLSDYLTEKVEEDIIVKVRTCKDCRSVVFGRREFSEDVANKPGFVKVYENMVQFRRGIESLLPKFQKLLSNFDDPDKPPSHDLLAEASRVRKKLIYSFQEFDTAAKRILKTPTRSAQQSKLQNNVHIAAMQVLQVYMLPLKSLPSVLKHNPNATTSATPLVTKITTLSEVQ
ncbi:FYVE zinc finger-domain-containing protein [Myxozyma melibiosi]|uniref:FYVE zinc finger-domain-containing protein n=1 Tax=Myxozyma melibiosi TaxID=54550 RepID=A0ABR1F6U8_9ASCO